jgi:hypothetical protein
MGKQWELWADISEGGFRDILRQIGQEGWFVDSNAAGTILLAPSDGPKPDGLDDIMAALEERGITCTLS